MRVTGRNGYERVTAPVGIIPPQSAERTSRISPQHLYRVVLPTRPEQDGCLHLSRLLLRSIAEPLGIGAPRRTIYSRSLDVCRSCTLVRAIAGVRAPRLSESSALQPAWSPAKNTS